MDRARRRSSSTALDDVAAGDRLLVLTWLHLGDRDALRVHPRDDVTNPLRGVFSTRSASRPNPIGLHEVEVLEVDGAPAARRAARGDRRHAGRGSQAGAVNGHGERAGSDGGRPA